MLKVQEFCPSPDASLGASGLPSVLGVHETRSLRVVPVLYDPGSCSRVRTPATFNINSLL